MKRFSSFVICALLALSLNAQSNQKLYVNLVSHNELQGESYDTDQAEYNTAKATALQILNHLNGIGGKWNFQCCSKFVLGCLNWDNAANVNTDLLETMFLSGNVELDPRNKTEFPNYLYNISDVYHLYDSCGVTSTHTVGGFLCYPYTSEDWTQFRNVKMGAVYHQPWMAEIIWGGGSPNHVADANNYGFWKPLNGDSEQHLYTHDPTANLWLVGNGCAPVIYDTTNNVQWIVNLIRSNCQSIQNGSWPSDRFYSLSVMTNVRDFDSPNYFVKVRTVLDSIDAFVDQGLAEWSVISNKLSLFQQWAAANSVASCQWTCSEATATMSVPEVDEASRLTLYPNPVSDLLSINGASEELSYEVYSSAGKILTFGELNPASKNQVSFEGFTPGIYFVKVGKQVYKVIKE